MITRTSQTRAELSQELLSYLIDHPRSEDTVEGIVEWWLLHHYVARTRTAVRGALRDLADRGLVLERKGADGTTTFRLNPRKRRLAVQLARKAH